MSKMFSLIFPEFLCLIQLFFVLRFVGFTKEDMDLAGRILTCEKAVFLESNAVYMSAPGAFVNILCI